MYRSKLAVPLLPVSIVSVVLRSDQRMLCDLLDNLVVDTGSEDVLAIEGFWRSPTDSRTIIFVAVVRLEPSVG